MPKSEGQIEMERMIREEPRQAYRKVKISMKAEISEIGEQFLNGIKAMYSGMMLILLNMPRMLIAAAALIAWPLTRLLLFNHLRKRLLEEPDAEILECVEVSDRDAK